MANSIHPTAIIGPGVKLGDNNYIGPYCIIGMPAEHRDKWNHYPGEVIIGNDNIITGHVTIDGGMDNPTKIGNNCFLMKHSHVGHDAVVCDKVTISCGAKIGGHTIIFPGTNIGLNAVIHQRKIIPEYCMIGMGAVVTGKLRLEAYYTYAGNPAKRIGPNKKYIINESSSSDAELQQVRTAEENTEP